MLKLEFLDFVGSSILWVPLLGMAVRELQPALSQVNHPLSYSPSRSVLVFPVRYLPLAAKRLLSDSIFCHCGRASVKYRALPNGGKKGEVEKLWEVFFYNPSEWRDHRVDKANPKFPDFKHKKTNEGLWLDSKWIPPWVEAKVAAIPPGTLEVSIYSWNKRLSRCVKTGQYEKTIRLFHQMQQEGIDSDRFTFIPVLNAFASLGVLEDGRRIHTQIIQSGFDADIYVGSSLVDMYAKCGSMEDSERVFNEMPTRNVVAWNAMILGYVKCGEGRHALQLFGQMQQDSVDPDSVTFMAGLNACASLGALEDGRRIHRQIIENSFDADIHVACSLVDMYAKCGSIADAERVFSKMPTSDVVAWTAMILGYVKCGEGQKALALYRQMELESVDPNSVTFVAVLNACASLEAVDEGRCAHELIIQRGYESNVYVGSSLVDMYAKCGSIADAEIVFNKMPMRNVVAWTAMILGYVKCGEGRRALELYKQMESEGVDPNPVTFVGVLNACASVAALEEGRRAHEQIISRGFESNVYVGSSLVDMYAKCGSIVDAERVFNKMPMRNVVAWTAMILGYLNSGEGQHALELFGQMQGEGLDPESFTFVAILNACASLAVLEKGRYAHEQIIRRGYQSDIFVGSSLVDMYAKCGSIDDAERVFKEMPRRDVVAWTAMILGYVNCGKGWHALELFGQMQWEGVDPDSVTFVVVLNACASVAALEEGERAHQQIIQRGYESDVIVGCSLVDMYAKCGSIDDAEKVFNKMPTRDVVAWTAMLAGYGWHGDAKRALEHFKQMCAFVEVNGVTFVSLLSACSHGGLVDEGLELFKSMSAVYNISPTAMHYSCVVDLLGRAGRLHEAEDMIRTMPVEANACVWMSLLGACRVHENVDMGERSAKQVRELDPKNAAGYVLLSNIYATAGKWDRSASTNQARLDRGAKRTLGRSWIEVNNKVHSFVVDDTEHPQIVEIHAELKRLSRQLTDVGYAQDLRFVLHCVDEDKKEFHLCHHSEKLAIGFGLISMAPGTPVHIVKNLQMCVDCHTATKFIGKMVRRAIIVRDANRFHHFQDGICSCRDYW